MHVAPPPRRRKSPERVTGTAAPPGCTAGGSGAHIPPVDAAGIHALDDPVSWDHFAVEVADSPPPVVVHCRGGLDFAYADQLRSVLARIIERELVVDLHRLTFIDSTGLSVLLTARRTLSDVGGRMAILGASGLVRRAFEAAELADVLDD
ncbi:MAG: STAS domain-containing protein [Acidimicrobiales bacterium]